MKSVKSVFSGFRTRTKVDIDMRYTYTACFVIRVFRCNLREENMQNKPNINTRIFYNYYNIIVVMRENKKKYVILYTFT